jgi:hypothetical protein
MLVTKGPKPSNYKAIRTYKTFYIWSSDGWTYNTVTKVRMKYVITNSGNFHIIFENWDTIHDQEFREEIEISILSEKPLIWIEKGVDFEEMYTEHTKKNQ